MSQQDYLHADLTNIIIKGYFHVYNHLGYGFLEKVYERALASTLRKYGLQIEQQIPINVYFESEHVGEYFADLIVDRKVIIELKSVESLNAMHEAQLLNYLRATNFEVGLLMNFGTEPCFKRKIFTNDRKELPVIDSTHLS